jgi:glycosyltransferase involved in cell wall biosynthesis
MARPVDIVVPVFNEAGSIDEFIARVERIGLRDALIFVDNASTDGTLERLARHPVRVLRHATNLGYGASVRDGIAASDGEKVVILDADLEFPPEAVPELLQALDRHAVVYCSRFRGATPPPMPRFRRFGNALASRLYNLLYGQHTTDVYTGMKGLRRRALPLHALRRNGFVHGAEIAALIAFSGQQIAEIAVDFAPRQGGRSKMRHIPETVKLLASLVGYWLRGMLTRWPQPPPRRAG